MADEVWLKPDQLIQAANDMADHGESMLTAHQSAHDEAGGAHSGWVGSSAGALSGLLDDWETTTTAHLGRIGDHSCDMHFTAADFTLHDQQSTRRLNEVGRAGGAETSSMQ